MATKTRRQRRKTIIAKEKNLQNTNFRFIVPMPGKSAWHYGSNELLYKKMHSFPERAGDFALEEYQAQFLMQREYLID